MCRSQDEVIGPRLGCKRDNSSSGSTCFVYWTDSNTTARFHYYTQSSVLGNMVRFSWCRMWSEWALLLPGAAGDANVPAGQLTWRAAAAALPTPWPAEEQSLVDLRLAMVAATTESAAHLAEVEAEEQAAGNVIAALMQQDDPEVLLPQPEQDQQQLQGDAVAGLPGNAAAQHDAGMLAGGIAGFAMQQARASVARIRAWAAEMQARRVVAIHKGQGQVASRGFKDPNWVEGRLWVYEDGSCGFVFMVRSHVYHLIDLERLDSDL